MKKVLIKKGPLLVGVSSENKAWRFYKKGIHSDNNTIINHGVVLMGYTKDYWIIKNSWGEQWGMKGYMHLKMGNTSSVCTYGFYS